MLAASVTPDGYQVNADGAWVENGVVQTKNTKLSTTEAQGAGTEAYKGVLELYRTALSEKWDAEKAMEHEMTYLIRYMDGPEDMGYAFIDADGNGVLELVTGPMTSDGKTNKIYDLYTLADNQPVHLFSGGERSHYGLCTNHRIENESSGGAAHAYYSYYRIGEDAKTLVFEEGIYINSEAAEWPETEKWLYLYTVTGHDRNDYSRISRTKARNIIDSYEVMEISLTPFSE